VVKRAFLVLAVIAVTALRLDAQADNTLTRFVPRSGEIDGEPQTFQFTGNTGEPLSFVVEATSGNLDPVLTLRDRSGQIIASNDDYNYPDSRDALLEAVTIPEFGTYTLSVSAFGNTRGEFEVTLLPGYSELAHNDDFEDVEAWKATGDGAIEDADGALILALGQETPHTVAFNEALTPPADFFAQVTATNPGVSGWTVGLAARAQSEDEYYLFLVNDRAEWRFSLQTADGERVLRDWTRHPAIRADQPRFTLGLLAADSMLEAYFNGNILGRLSDNTITAAGQLGLVVGRTRVQTGIASTFDDLYVTTPREADGLIAQIIPSGTPNTTVTELQRRRLIPGSGQIVLNVGESFSEYTRPGVNILPIASGLTFADFAIGTTVYPDSITGALGGCGLVVRSVDPTHYLLAYFDGQGGVGMSERDGDTFLPGLYIEVDNWNATAGHRLLVIALGNTLHYYVDGRYVGELQTELESGGVGNAVVNFETADTSCRFQNTWLWRAD